MKRNILIGVCAVPVLLLYLHFKGERSLPVAEAPSLYISSGTIGSGGSLYQSLLSEKFSRDQVESMIKVIRPKFNLQSSRAGDIYEVYRATSGAFLSLTYWSDPTRYFTVKESSGKLEFAKHEIELNAQLMAVSGTVETSLWEALSKQGVEAELIFRFVDLFAWQIDFLTEPRVGDKFYMMWNRGEGRGLTREKEILGAVYDGKETGKIAAIYFGNQYFMPDGKSMERQFLRAPLKFRRISSYFTNKRYHPVLRYYRPHHGIDYSAATGTPVASVGHGVVIAKGWGNGLGNMVKIRHSNSSYTSIYGHLSGFARGLFVGKRVSQGELIGYVGSTGLSTGPHLHFGMERDGALINFLSIKMPPARQITSGKERAEFEATKESVLNRLDSLGLDKGMLALLNLKPVVSAETKPSSKN